MSFAAPPPPPQRPDRHTPSEFAAGYPPSGASNRPFPAEGPLYTPKPKRQLDRLVGTVITFMVVLAVFAVIVALLTNISPNAPTELVPDQVAPRQDAISDEPDQTIVGD